MASRTRGYFTPVRNPGDLVDIVEEVSFADIEKVTLEQEKTRVEAKPFRITADGSWAGFLALEPGANTIRATAVAEEGATAERRIQVSLVDERRHRGGRPARRPRRAAQSAARGLPADRAPAAPRRRARAQRGDPPRAAGRDRARAEARRASAPISSASSSSSRARTGGRRLALGAVLRRVSRPCATVKSRFSLNTLSGFQPGTCDMRGIPVVIAPVGSITQGSFGVLEPERDHVVLPVGRPHDDGAEHLVVAEAELAQEVEGEQLEPVAVVAVVLERLLERGPVIDGAVGDVVVARLLLDPGARARARPAASARRGTRCTCCAASRAPRDRRAAAPRPPAPGPRAPTCSRCCQPRILRLHASSGAGAAK